MHPWRRTAVMAASVLALSASIAGCGASSHSTPPTTREPIAHQPTTETTQTTISGCAPDCGGPPPAVTLTTGTGPAKQYDCTFNLVTDAYTGAFGTASAIGWEGNHQGVVTCLGGTFYVQDGINKNFGFGIYGAAPTNWVDAGGYLPAQITTFGRSGADVAITEFADEVTLGGRAYVAVYSRVAIRNTTAAAIESNPGPSAGMVVLNVAPDTVMPHATAVHDYVVAVDRFGNDYPWPSAGVLASAGSVDQHFRHMAAYWKAQLDDIAEVDVPDTALDDAYKSGFIFTQIARSGNDMNTGVNGYESEFSHDVIGILSTLFAQGYFTDAHALLLEDRNVVGSAGQYDDGIWTYALPWAIYLLKTGDLSFVKQNFATEGPKGSSQPSIEDTVRDIASARTGPGGIMKATDDIDTNGYWTVDDYEALMGLTAYRYLAQRVGDPSQAQWAASQYDALLAATNRTLDATIRRYGLDYLPCSMVQPNTSNRCKNPEDANWAASFQFGRWAWDGQLFGAQVNGPGLTLIDATYSYGFARLKGILPPDTFGGYPSDYYTTGYNAGYGNWGLASVMHRDQGILSYEFMIRDDQSGPLSWWESSSGPSTTTPWIGTHPGAGQGASPHAWGIAQANRVLLDSLVAQASDGSLVVGRGVPAKWLGDGMSLSVSNFPTTDGRRLNLEISTSGLAVKLSLTGQSPSGQVLFELPAFVNDIASTSSGSIDQQTGTVRLNAGITSVTVKLLHPPSL